MDINTIVKDYGIVGVISNYETNIKKEGLVKDLDIKNISQALKMVLLDDSYLDKKINDLTLSEIFKIDLMTKLNKDIIIIGNLSQVLNYKDLEYIKKLLLKLNNDYHKKIIIIDNDVKVFFNLVKMIVVLKDKNIIYKTNDLYDDKLYEYTKCPKIIEFIKYLNENNISINKTLDIYELIKDIYRSAS